MKHPKSATSRFLRCSPFDEYMVWKRWVENKSALAADRMNTLVKSLLLRYATSRASNPGFFQIPDPGVCTLNGEIFSNVYEMNVLDTIKRHLYCFYTFVVRRPLQALEHRIQIKIKKKCL